MRKQFARFILRLFGWHLLPLPEDRPQGSVICVAPHTSNWDFLLGLLFSWALGFHASFLMKSDWFFFPLGLLLKALGGIPVNRKQRGQMVDRLQHLLRERGRMHLAITPEGTRSKAEKWKSGFYHIAVEANLPIELAVIDYGRKSVGIFEVFRPTGDIDQDLSYIRGRYNKGQAKYPEQFTP